MVSFIPSCTRTTVSVECMNEHAAAFVLVLVWMDVSLNHRQKLSFYSLHLLTQTPTHSHTIVICMHTKVAETGKSLPIWWKSSLTMMQLVQFVTMMSQGGNLLATQCHTTSLRVVVAYIVYILSLFILFAQFFMASYIKPKKSGDKVKRA